MSRLPPPPAGRPAAVALEEIGDNIARSPRAAESGSPLGLFWDFRKPGVGDQPWYRSEWPHRTPHPSELNTVAFES